MLKTKRSNGHNSDVKYQDDRELKKSLVMFSEKKNVSFCFYYFCIGMHAGREIKNDVTVENMTCKLNSTCGICSFHIAIAFTCTQQELVQKYRKVIMRGRMTFLQCCSVSNF